jgi:hypothetical protein
MAAPVVLSLRGRAALGLSTPDRKARAREARQGGDAGPR